jgi:hypothetical protein
LDYEGENIQQTFFPYAPPPRENIDTIKKSREAFLDAAKEVGLEVNPEETKYMLMSCSRKIGQKHSIKIGNRSFEDVASSDTSE